MAKERNLEQDPIDGSQINRLTNYNNSEPVDFDPPAPGMMGLRDFFEDTAPVSSSGGASVVDFVDYDRSRYDGRVYREQLGNLEHIRSQNQGTLDVLGRAVSNFVGQTAVHTVGGLTSFVYGGVKALAEGDIRGLWDNELLDLTDKMSDGIRDYFKVYNSNDYNQRNLISRMFLNPAQFTDDLLDTLSFTAAAVLTEMISGGTASAAILPRAMRMFRQANKISTAGEVASKVMSTGNQFGAGMRRAGTLTRQLATGAAYEGFIEARQAGLELRNKLHENWLEDNPGLSLEDMPEEVRESIDQRLTDGQLFTTLLNVALVGASNIIQFPKVFSSNYNNRAQNISKRLVRGEDSTFTDALTDISNTRRRLSNIATAVRNPFMEGVVEEGGQAVIGTTATEYFGRKYNDDYTFDVNDLLTAFGKGIMDTYTTAEGWEEIGMGMIVGAIGAPGRGVLSLAPKNSVLGRLGYNEDGSRRELWTGGVVGAFQERSAKELEIAETIDELNENTSLLKSMKANYDYLRESKFLENQQELALEAGDVFNYRNLQDDQVHSFIMSRLKAGLGNDLNSVVEDIERLTPEELYTEFRGEEAAETTSEEDMRKFKMDHVQALKDRIKATKRAFNRVSNSPHVADNEDLQDFLTHTLASASYLDIREKQMNGTLQNLTGGVLGGEASRASNTMTIEREIKSLESLMANKSVDKASKDAVKPYLDALKNIPDKGKKISSTDASAIRTMYENSPTEASLIIEEVVDLLSDSILLRERRHALINTFNNYFTREGVEKLKSAREEAAREERKKSETRRAKEKESKRQEKAKKENKDKRDKLKAKKAEESSKTKTTEVSPVEETTPVAEAPVVEEVETETVPQRSFADIEGEDPFAEQEDDLPFGPPLTEEEMFFPEGTIAESQALEQLRLDETLEETEAEEPLPEKLTKEAEARLEEIEASRAEALNNLRPSDVAGALGSPEFIANITAAREAIHAEHDAMREEVLNNLNETLEDAESLDEVTDEIAENDNTRETFEEELEEVELNTSSKNIQTQNNQLNIKGRKRTVGAALAYSSVDKQLSFNEETGESRYVDVYNPDGSIKLNEFFNRNLLSRELYVEGEPLYLRTVSYKELEARGIEDYSEDKFNKDSQDVESFSIGVFDKEGNLLGFYPSTSNVRRNVVQDDDGVLYNTLIEENIEERRKIFNNKDAVFKATITSKSSGIPMTNSRTNKKPLFEALGDGTKLNAGIELAIGKTMGEGDSNVSLVTNSSADGALTKNLTLASDDLGAGMLYAILPTSKNGVYHPYALDINPVGRNTADVIVEALKIFAKRDKTDSEKRSLSNIEGFNINDFKGLMDFIGSIMYFKSSFSNDNNTFRIEDRRLFLSPSDPSRIFALDDIASNPAVAEEVAKILALRFPTFKIDDINSTRPYLGYEFDESTGVINAVEYRNFQEFASKNNLINTPATFIELESGEKVYSVQPVIEISKAARENEDKVPENIRNTAVPTTEDSVFESRLKGIENRMQEELTKPFEAVKRSKTKEQLIKNALEWINIDPYDSSSVSTKTRGTLMTPGLLNKE